MSDLSATYYVYMYVPTVFAEYFETIIKACYNLNVVQILARLSCGLSKRY